jgi:L-seryl-tRNA(Ser) seleniumtransferase
LVRRRGRPKDRIAMDREKSLSAIPPVDAVLNHVEAAGTDGGLPRPLVVRAVRRSLEAERAAILEGRSDLDGTAGEIRKEILRRVEAELRRTHRRQLVPVINATGIVVHTNLGRAPLSASAVEAMAEVASGYSNLEYDLTAARRGRRNNLVREALCELTGAEDALVVNNNAAAVMLVLNTLAEGREVVVSRGELIEIGDSFRLPDVFERSGSRLVEVGTTNRTRLSDFREAVRSSTGAFLSAHWSNYTMSGFVERVPLGELAKLGESYGIPVIHDLGSGILADPASLNMPGEMTVAQSVASGVTVSTFSGDKLLGGPQAGVVVGRSRAIERMLANPLMRALRPGKLTLAALQATLDSYLRGTHVDDLPVLASISVDAGVLADRARSIERELGQALSASARVSVVELDALVGGGAAPELVVPSRGIEIEPLSVPAGTVTARMLECEPPVVARTREDRIVVDLRTVRPDDDALVVRAIREALERE